MPLTGPFYVEPKSPTKYVPRTSTESVTSIHVSSRGEPLSPTSSVETKYVEGLKPPRQHMGSTFFDSNHKRWKTNEAKIQQATQLNKYRLQSQPISPTDNPIGIAHPLSSPLSPQYEEFNKWIDVCRRDSRYSSRENEILGSHPRQAISPKDSERRFSTIMEKSCSNQRYGSPESVGSYHSYFARDQSDEEGSSNSSRTTLISNGQADVPSEFPTRFRRPPPLKLRKSITRRSPSVSIASTLSPTKRWGDLTQFIKSYSTKASENVLDNREENGFQDSKVAHRQSAKVVLSNKNQN